MPETETLSELKNGATAEVISIGGDGRFLSRIASIGIVPGTTIEMVSNQKKYPFLIFGRGSLVAINREEGEKINVKTIEGDR
jgi:ferrous iron transport protein A